MSTPLPAFVPAWAFAPALLSTVQLYRIAGSTLADVVALGERPAPRAGRGTEWFGHREYIPGDPLNLVDWRLLARHADRKEAPIYVKTFDAELANLTTIAVDCSGSMDTWPGEGKLASGRQGSKGRGRTLQGYDELGSTASSCGRNGIYGNVPVTCR